MDNLADLLERQWVSLLVAFPVTVYMLRDSIYRMPLLNLPVKR
jgi:hypothetical protein